MKTNKTTWAMAFALALVGATAFFSGRATAEDKENKEGAPPAEAKINECPLVKGLLGAWSIVGKGSMGDSTGKATYSLACGDTMLLTHYESKSAAMGAFHGFGALKTAADGKTATMWWFDSFMPGAMVFTGPITENGYELDTKDGPMGEAKVKMTKKGATWEFKLMAGGEEFVSETYTRAK